MFSKDSENLPHFVSNLFYTGAVFDAREWHDGFLFKFGMRMNLADGKVHNLVPEEFKDERDVFEHTSLYPTMVHFKGPQGHHKVQAASELFLS